MAGLNVALEAAKRALFSQQTAVNVTGHNIANVNTPGFSRQRAVMVTGLSLNVPGGRVGTGVSVATIERVYDRFLAAQISVQVQGKGKSEAEMQVLDQVQAIFDETSGGGSIRRLTTSGMPGRCWPRTHKDRPNAASS